jgi:hypothetical protein
VSADQEIDRLLGSLGFGLPETRQRARDALEEAGLTRPGKLRISAKKVPRARAVLKERFSVQCGAPQCAAKAQSSGRDPLPAEPRSCCEFCGGSANQRAEQALIEACARQGVRKVAVVGGSPAVREELGAALGATLELRMIDGTERRTLDRAKKDLEWADLVLVWGASELHHKVSLLYTHGVPEARHKVVQVAKRGVAALLGAAVEHLERRR